MRTGTLPMMSGAFRRGFLTLLLLGGVQEAWSQCPGSPPAGIDCVATTASKQITAHSQCRGITNNHASGLALMVPTSTSTEWAAFYNNPPAGVAVAGCDSLLDGFEVDPNNGWGGDMMSLARSTDHETQGTYSWSTDVFSSTGGLNISKSFAIPAGSTRARLDYRIFNANDTVDDCLMYFSVGSLPMNFGPYVTVAAGAVAQGTADIAFMPGQAGSNATLTIWVNGGYENSCTVWFDNLRADSVAITDSKLNSANWNNISVSGGCMDIAGNTVTVGGINTPVTLSAEIGAVAATVVEYRIGAGAWTALSTGATTNLSPISQGETLQFRVDGFAPNGTVTPVTIRNTSDGNLTVDTFNINQGSCI